MKTAYDHALIHPGNPRVLLVGLLMGALLAGAFSLYQLPASWQEFALLSFITLWHILPSLLLILVFQPWLAQLSWRAQAIWYWAIAVAVSVLVQLAANWTTIQANVINVPLVTAAIAAIICYALYQHRMASYLQAMAAQAQADALRARIHPHFLFNSLNSIASLATIDGQRTEAAVLALADIFRASLQDSRQFHSLDDELNIIHAYLELESLRLAERLHYDEQITAHPPVALPVLLLQPLIENAVRHGIAANEPGGIITLKTSEDDAFWRISISNTLADQPTKPGNGMALESVKARLRHAFGDHSKVLRSIHENRYQVTLLIDKHYENTDR